MIAAGLSDRNKAKTYDGARRRASTKRGAVNLALIGAMLCFLWQAIAFQTHFHLPFSAASPVAGSITASQVTLQKNQPKPVDPADCPICQERAHTGAYLAPEPVVVSLPEAVAIWAGAMPSLASSSTRRSHAWQSRAPPLQLQP